MSFDFCEKYHDFKIVVIQSQVLKRLYEDQDKALIVNNDIYLPLLGAPKDTYTKNNVKEDRFVLCTELYTLF